jgi:cysteinyl-tRNA synthetase
LKADNDSMKLYNTLSQRVEELSFPDGVVKLYVCGITPYDTSHLGHARVGVVYDTLRRYLTSQGLQVRYVQNITDIDDPLFERARRDGVDWRELGEQQTQRYLDSLARLNVERPSFFVRATSVIPQMFPIIERLLELGHAYVSDGAVYYSAASKPDYGALAHVPHAHLLPLANEMGNIPDDPRKREPLDFVLWQPSQPDEPAWDSPWGPGRPGWHIECSTMACEYLGPQIDIHGGGADLIFPHHSSEIAQAEPVTGVVPFVRCWMHTGLVSLGGTKMSKSLGNMVFVDEVVRSHSAAALRLAILMRLYRAPWEYANQDVERAEQHIATIRRALATSFGNGPTIDGMAQHAAFYEALASDLNTPAAIDQLVALALAILEAQPTEDVRPAQRQLLEMCQTLGIQIFEH